MKTAIVTGISSGIGKEICKHLVANNYFVYGTYLKNKENAELVKTELKNVEIYQVDLTKREQTYSFIQKINHLKLDALINNAGFYSEDRLNNENIEVWDSMIEGLLTAPNILIRKLAGNFNKNASIVNICSIYGSVIFPCDSIAYTVAKSGLQALTKALSIGFSGKDIRVNGIAPGVIETPITKLSEESKKVVINETPINKLGQPEYIAQIVKFLISDESIFINGQVIVADGGHTNYNHFFCE